MTPENKKLLAEVSACGGWDNYFNRRVAAQNARNLDRAAKDIIRNAIGRLSSQLADYPTTTKRKRIATALKLLGAGLADYQTDDPFIAKALDLKPKEQDGKYDGLFQVE